MPTCRVPFTGGCWFFTVNLLERRNALRLLRPTACPFRVTNRQLRRPMRRRRLSSLHLSRMPRRPRVSERPDLDLAEPHDAAAVLKRDPPLGELGVLGAVDGLDAVEDHGELFAFGGDFIGVPLVAGLGHWLH